MNEHYTYLVDVVKAIQNVDPAYFVWNDFFTKDKEGKAMLEHVFCYEFYHQFRKIMECECNSKTYHNLIFSGEIKKNIALNCPLIIENNNENPNEKDRYPDFILHNAQDSIDKQELVIEVKTKNNITADNCLYDLLKIDKIIGNLAFKTGIFIAINMDNKELKDIIINALNKKHHEIKNLSKIYFMATESVRDDKCILKYFTINDLNQ